MANKTDSQKKLIQQLKSLNKQLRQSEQKYKNFFQTSRDAIVIFSPKDHRFVEANKAALKIFKCSKSELTTKTPSKLSPKYQPDGNLSTVKAKQLISTAIKKGSLSFEWEHQAIGCTNTFYAHILLTKLTFQKQTLLRATIRDITKQKELETELATNEEMYRNLFQNIPSGVAIYKAINNGNNFVFTDFNKTAEKIEMVRKKDVIGKKVTKLFPDIKKTDLLKTLKKVWQTGKPEYHPTSEYKDQKISGWRENWIYKLPSGLIAAIYNDVTDKKKSEIKLKETTQRLKLALNASNIGPWDWNLETNQVYFSAEWKAQIGYKPNELSNLYKEWEDRIHPEDKERVLTHVKEYMRGKRKEYDIDFRFRHKNGSYRWIHTQGHKQTKNGKPIRILGCHIDITKRKETEQKIKGTQQRLKLILDNMFDAIWTIDLEGNFTFVTPSIKNITGYSQKEIITKNIKDILTPESKDKALTTIEYYLQNPLKNINEPSVMQLELLCKNGTTKWCEIKANFIRDKKNRPLETIGIMRDISLQRKAFQSMRLAQLGKLVADMAHQVNNPLMIISGETQLIQMEDIKNQAIKGGLNTIVKQCNRAKDIIQRLLKFSKPQLQKNEPTDVNKIINNITPLLEKQYALKNVKIIKRLKKTPKILVNKGQMQEIFMNILTNAQEAIPQGGRIEIKTYTQDNKLIIDFTDTGKGMTKEEIKDIFRPFFTTKEKGTGLGIPVCYGLIKANKGKLEFQSKKGEGTTAKISFPLKRGNQDDYISSR